MKQNSNYFEKVTAKILNSYKYFYTGTAGERQEFAMNEDFFNTLRQTITDTAEAVGKKTEELVEMQKIRSKTISIQRGIDKNYKILGELVYQRFAAGESMDEEVTEICDLILEQVNELSSLKEELAARKNQNCCPNCGSRNPMAAAFCMNCGTKLPVVEVPHAEEEDMEDEEMKFEDEESENEVTETKAETEEAEAVGEEEVEAETEEEAEAVEAEEVEAVETPAEVNEAAETEEKAEAEVKNETEQ